MTFHVSTAITLFMTSREQLKVWTFQGGSVNFRLKWCQLTVHDDFLLLWKYLCKFLLLRSAQKKRPHFLLKLKQTFLSFSNRSRHGFDFSHTKYGCHVVILKYLLRISENMWVDDLKQTPKIQQTILNGRTCTFLSECRMCIEFTHYAYLSDQSVSLIGFGDMLCVTMSRHYEACELHHRKHM